MTSIMLTVNGAQAWANVTGPLTSGMVGIPITMEYDAAWDGLMKNLVCRCSEWGCDTGECRAILNVGETAVVAHEVMKSDLYLYLGIEGYSPDGTLVMPTTWAMCGKIQNGANTVDDLTADPTLPVWEQLQAELQTCVQSAQRAADAASGSEETAAAAAEDAAASMAAALRSEEAADQAAGTAQSAAAQALESAQEATDAVADAIIEHNENVYAHGGLRRTMQILTERLNAALDSDDTTLDQLSEIVAYIKSNKSLIDAITTAKVSVADIVNDLTTDDSSRPLSAAMGMALRDALQELEQAAEETEQKLDALMQGAGSEWEALTVTDVVGRLLSPKGGLLNGTPAEDKLVSEPISIQGSDTLRVTGSAKYGNSLWAIYNSAGEMIANQVAPATAAGLTVAEQEIEAPSGAASIRVAWDKTISDTPYAVSRKAAEQTAAALPLDGQTLVVLGDSIVQGQGVANDLCTRLAAATGANVVNLGVGGTGWMHRQEEGNAYYQRVADVPEDADIVILSGGGNDRNDPLGTADSTGTDTVAGCIHATLDAVRARVPAARVCVAAPTPWQYYPPHERGNDIARLVDVMAEICRRRGIPFLDLYHTSGLAPWDDTIRALLFVDGDGVHPNDLGYGVFAPQFVQLAMGGSHNPVDVQGVAEAVLAALPKWTGGAY